MGNRRRVIKQLLKGNGHKTYDIISGMTKGHTPWSKRISNVKNNFLRVFKEK